MDNITQVGQQALFLIEKLACKVGVGLEGLFPYAIKECYVEGVSNLIFLILSLIMSIIFTKKSVKSWVKYDSDSESSALSYNISVCKTIIAVLSVVAFTVSVIVFFSWGIHNLINPEFHAIEKMVSLGKSLITQTTSGQ